MEFDIQSSFLVLLLVLLLSLLSTCQAQSTAASAAADSADCLALLYQSDANEDGFLEKSEYIQLVTDGLDGCYEELNMIDAIFYSFACKGCSSPTDPACCVRNETHISLQDALLPSFCVVVITAIQSTCPGPTLAPVQGTTQSPSRLPTTLPTSKPSTVATLQDIVLPYLVSFSVSNNANYTSAQRSSWLMAAMDLLAQETWDLLDGEETAAQLELPSRIYEVEECGNDQDCWNVLHNIRMVNTTKQRSEAFLAMMSLSIQNGWFYFLVEFQTPEGVSVSIEQQRLPTAPPSPSPMTIPSTQSPVVETREPTMPQPPTVSPIASATPALPTFAPTSASVPINNDIGIQTLQGDRLPVLVVSLLGAAAGIAGLFFLFCCCRGKNVAANKEDANQTYDEEVQPSIQVTPTSGKASDAVVARLADMSEDEKNGGMEEATVEASPILVGAIYYMAGNLSNGTYPPQQSYPYTYSHPPYPQASVYQIRRCRQYCESSRSCI
jgi:hypothetical protein